jgi:hypothetical protein
MKMGHMTILTFNLLIMTLYLSFAIIVSVVDFAYSDDADDPPQYYKYLIINLDVWWVTVLVLLGRLYRDTQRRLRRKKK